jgi:putative chitinase
MDLESAIRAAAPDAPIAAIEGLERARIALDRIRALAGANRAAHLIGQCAHESGGLVRLAESLFYTTPERLMAVWPSRFRSRASALPFLRNPRLLANTVYSDRNGNGGLGSGDGYRFRGRGYLQLTGRANYAEFGALSGVDLISNPDRASEPATAWLIAGHFLARRKRNGRTALEWADAGSVEVVTRIVNGGVNGMEDRRELTACALAALQGAQFFITLQRGDSGPAVERLQSALARHGFAPGAIDGDFGPATERALRGFQGGAGLVMDGIAGSAVWAALSSAIRTGAGPGGAPPA